MSVRQLDHLNLSVRDLAETEDWYGRLLGFDVVERGTWRGRPWAILKAGEALLCAYEDPTRRHLDGDALREEGLHGVAHVGVRIDSEAEWSATLKREQPPLFHDSPVRYPHSTSWYLKDPTGYGVEVACWDDGRAEF